MQCGGVVVLQQCLHLNTNAEKGFLQEVRQAATAFIFLAAGILFPCSRQHGRRFVSSLNSMSWGVIISK